MREAPLTDADYAAIRRNVLAAINPKRRFSLAFRLAFAAIVVTFAVLITPRPSPPQIPMTVDRAKLAVATPPPITNSQPPTPNHQSPQHPAPSTQHPAPGPRHSAPNAPSPLPPVRIEIQTSDPDVRIIWIANQTVSTEEPS